MSCLERRPGERMPSD